MAYIHQISHSISTEASDRSSRVSDAISVPSTPQRLLEWIHWARREHYWITAANTIIAALSSWNNMKPQFIRWRPTCAWKHRRHQRHHRTNSFRPTGGDHLFMDRIWRRRLVAKKRRIWRAKELLHLLDYVVDGRLYLPTKKSKCFDGINQRVN